MAALLLGVLDDDEFAARKLALIPSMLRVDAEHEYNRKYAKDKLQGNLWLFGVVEFAESLGGADLAASDKDICLKAAQLAASQVTAAGRTEQQIRRALRRHQGRAIEKLAYKIGVVRKGHQEYASRQTIYRRQQQKKRWQAFGEATILSLGDKQCSLDKIMISRACCRAAELYHFAKALESIAEQDGLDWSMWTLNAPGEFHPAPSHGKNTWDDSTDPRQAHEFIAVRWGRVRACLAKLGIKLTGIRVTEPQGDGCAHWHLAIFFKPEDGPAIRAAFRAQWPTNIGAHEVIGDREKGGFASYMFKYISQAIAISDQGKEANHACIAADAWRSTWSIRAFQFFGMPSLSLWRELRRQTVAPAGDDSVTAALWRSARRTDGVQFIRLAGALAASRNRFKVAKVDTDQRTTQTCIIDGETGESVKLEPRPKWQMSFANSVPVTLIHSYPREKEEHGKLNKTLAAGLAPGLFHTPRDCPELGRVLPSAQFANELSRKWRLPASRGPPFIPRSL